MKKSLTHGKFVTLVNKLVLNILTPEELESAIEEETLLPSTSLSKPIDPKTIQRDTLLLKKQMDAESLAFANKLIAGLTPLELGSALDAFVGQLIPYVANYTRKILRKHGVQPNVVLGGDPQPAKKRAKKTDDS